VQHRARIGRPILLVLWGEKREIPTRFGQGLNFLGRQAAYDGQVDFGGPASKNDKKRRYGLKSYMEGLNTKNNISESTPHSSYRAMITN
jgi:hypothetical protein